MTPSVVQGGIEVLSTLVETEFPRALTFNLEAHSTANITKIALQYKIKKISYATIISEARPEFAPAPKVKLSWTWDMRKEVSLPVGTYETVGTVALAPRDTTTLTYDLDVSADPFGLGKYYVIARCWYYGFLGENIKEFGFSVVP